MDRAEMMKEWETTEDAMESIRLDAKMNKIIDKIIEKYGL